jgi:hypothetical protein
MCKSTRIVSLISIIFAVALVGNSFAAGEISDITVTPDGRRIAIRSNASMGSYTEDVIANPARLIIDIAGTSISSLPSISGLAEGSMLNIRTGNTTSGARVVLDFGNRPVPDHRIVKMNNYLLVLLAQAASQEALLAKPSVERLGPEDTAPAVPKRTFRAKRIAADAAPNTSDLTIRSARVVDGIIVLKLASKTNPAMAYKVDLGVDLRHMGFSTARITPIRSVASVSEIGQKEPRRLRSNLMANFKGVQEESVSAGSWK